MTSRLYVVGKTAAIREQYEIGSQLGQPGQFGVARLCRYKATGDMRAVKIVSKARFHHLQDHRNHFDMLAAEISIMRKLKHPNIITLYDVFEDELNLYLVMELCKGGELFDRVQARGSYSERDASRVLRQITDALAYLHANKVTHLDLKPDNFLFADEADDAQVKVIDFGMSKVVGRRRYLRKLCGTPYYMAPEVIAGKYNEACDMWSIGIVMFVMLFGYPPFWADPERYPGRQADEMIFNLIKSGFSPVTKAGYGPYFPVDVKVSDSAKDLISKLLQNDVAERLTAEEALDHPWLKGETASDAPIAASVFKSLKEFHSCNKFKQAVLGLMTDKLGADEIEQLKANFKKIDVDNSGTITVKELQDALENGFTGLNEEMIRTIFENTDVDGDGLISYEELILARVNRQLSAKEERLWEAFRRLDLNGDGKVTAQELQEVLGKEGAEELIKEVDINNDGAVDYEEFLYVFDAQYQQVDEVEEAD